MQGDLHIMEGFHQQSKILQESNPCQSSVKRSSKEDENETSLEEYIELEPNTRSQILFVLTYYGGNWG